MEAVAKSIPATLLTLLLVTAVGVSTKAHAADPQQGPHWITAPPMSQARLGHAMVELPRGPNALGLSEGSGKVMVIGGFDSEPLDIGIVPANPLASCEIYDPTTNAWTPAAPHPVAAGWRWAVVLNNGMVLVAGGWSNASVDAFNTSSHLYDPKTNIWIATQPLPIGVTNPHGFMRAILLPNGQVLIAGGLDDNCCNSQNGRIKSSKKSYLFTLNPRNPAASSWQHTRSTSDGTVSVMPAERTTSGLVLMNNGVVLNVGGFGPPANGSEFAATNTADLYDPKAGTWAPAAPMPPVYGLGEDEKVQDYANAPGSRWSPYAELLGDGRVLVAGGTGGLDGGGGVWRKSALLYDPLMNTWSITNPMRARRGFGNWSGMLSVTGDILFSGVGYKSGVLHDAAGEIFHPATQQWSYAPTTNGPPADSSVSSFEGRMIRLSNGNLQVAGGADETTQSLGTSGSWIFVQ